MKRLFIVLIKYIPIIQMVGMLFNNILYCFSDIYIISYLCGHKEYGFKELSWSEKDFDKATLARIKKYRDKQGL